MPIAWHCTSVQATKDLKCKQCTWAAALAAPCPLLLLPGKLIGRTSGSGRALPDLQTCTSVAAASPLRALVRCHRTLYELQASHTRRYMQTPRTESTNSARQCIE